MATLQEYRQRPHWSFSAINQFLNICSLQFAFERVYRLEKAFTPITLSFGSAFHRTLEWLHLRKRDAGIPNGKEAGERFRDFWQRQVDEDRDIRWDEDITPESSAEQGAAMVAAFVEADDPEEEVLRINEVFAVPLIDSRGNMLEKPLVGEIDSVVGRDGWKKLVDWKTSARRWPKDQADKSPQATAYLYVYRQMYGQVLTMRFDVVVKNKTPVVERYETTRTQEAFYRMVELIKRVESMIAAEHWLPNEQGFYCGGCPFKAACRDWHREQARVCVRMAA